ncbi:MAG: hypothetical protein AAF798_17610 [Bacteroidota bacterium]
MIYSRALGLLLAVWLVPLTCIGQKLDGESVTLSYIQEAESPLQGDFKTYSVKVIQNGLDIRKFGFTASSLAERFLKLQDYQYKPTKGDFEIVVELSNDNFVSSESKKRVKTKGKGDAARKITTYYREVEYRMPLSYKLLDGKRELMREEIVVPFDKTMKKEYGNEPSISALTKKWNKERRKLQQEWLKEEFLKSMSALGNHLANKIDTRTLNKSFKFYSIRKASKYDKQLWDDAITAIEDAAKAKKTPQELKADLAEAMEDWKLGLESYDPSQKSEDDLYFVCSFNLSQVALLNRDFEACASYQELAVKADKKSNTLSFWKKFRQDLERRATVNTNVENLYVGTYSLLEETSNQSTAAPVEYTDFLVLHSQDTIYGIIDMIRGGAAHDIKDFKVENQSNAQQPIRSYASDQVQQVFKHGKIHDVLPTYLPDSAFPGIEMLVRVYRTEKAGLYTFNNGEKTRYFFMKFNADTYARSPSGLKFLSLNKGIRNYFKNCPTLEKKTRDKVYDRNKTSYIQVIDDYTSCN